MTASAFGGRRALRPLFVSIVLSAVVLAATSATTDDAAAKHKKFVPTNVSLVQRVDPGGPGTTDIWTGTVTSRNPRCVRSRPLYLEVISRWIPPLPGDDFYQASVANGSAGATGSYSIAYEPPKVPNYDPEDRQEYMSYKVVTPRSRLSRKKTCALGFSEFVRIYETAP